MKTLKRLLYGETLGAIGFVLLAFLALFSFFDLIEELPNLGRVSSINPQQVYGWPQALLYLALQLPGRVYELLPICLLIGSVFVWVRMAKSSEFTILRTSGFGPWAALRHQLWLGGVFALLTFATGDYLAPGSGRWAQNLQAQFQGQVDFGRHGAWLKERQGERQFAVNVGSFDPQGVLHRIQVFESDGNNQWVGSLRAERATLGSTGHWHLEAVEERQFKASGTSPMRWSHQEALDWPTGLNLGMVSVALLKPERMGTFELFQYMGHLKTNGQWAQRYEIEFWRKLFYPLSCFIMVVLALPFAYLHLRSGGIAGHVFGGVMLGISFFLISNVFGYIGNLHQLAPWLAAAAPSLLYALLSLAAFTWLVLRR